MREFLFRGQSIDRRKWYEGDLYQTRLKSVFYINYYTEHGDRMAVEVDPETVGQYTGLTDKNGTKIFEGDIAKAQDDIFSSPFCNGIIGKVVYEETAFFIEPQDPMETQWLFNECAVYEVIGNIHDNPELLKGGAE